MENNSKVGETKLPLITEEEHEKGIVLYKGKKFKVLSTRNISHVTEDGVIKKSRRTLIEI